MQTFKLAHSIKFQTSNIKNKLCSVNNSKNFGGSCSLDAYATKYNTKNDRILPPLRSSLKRPSKLELKINLNEQQSANNNQLIFAQPAQQLLNQQSTPRALIPIISQLIKGKFQIGAHLVYFYDINHCVACVIQFTFQTDVDDHDCSALPCLLLLLILVAIIKRVTLLRPRLIWPLLMQHLRQLTSSQ